MSSNPPRKRPDVVAFAKEMQARYPNILAHLAEIERAEQQADFSTGFDDEGKVSSPEEDQDTRI